MAKRLTATVFGGVQGVGYRVFARDAARRLSVGGTVRNLPEGSVHVVAEGTQHNLQEFLAQLERGPWAARVERVAFDWDDIPDDAARSSFEVVG